MKTSCVHIIVLFCLLTLHVACSSTGGKDVWNASPELSAIDSLMWQQPDSALAVMMEYQSENGRDGACTVSTDNTFNNHYAQLLTSELLFKNNFAQTNRTELMAAMDYFDSLTLVSDQNPKMVFLDARAHYMNGVGYYEHDSLPEACAEYLHTLRIMENRFSENELVGKKARFMALTHNRLMELFSHQFMQELAIYCGKQSVAYDRIAHSEPIHLARTLLHIGQQYTKMDEYDSAAYYYDLTLNHIPDRNTFLYRDWVALTALNNYYTHHDTLATLDSLKSMIAQSASESERLTRFLAIGSIYSDIGRDDSAKYYFEHVFEYEEKSINKRVVSNFLRLIALKEGDTLKANQYAQVMAENSSSPGESQGRVSQLNEMFQSYLQEKQEAASLRERKKAVKTDLVIVLALVVVLAIVTIVIRRKHQKRLSAQEAAAQKRLSETERELKTQIDEAIQQSRTMLPQRANDIYLSKVSNRMERIVAEFEAAYPQVLEQLTAAYPDLNETERQIAVLNFLHFRSKEEADLLGFTENTIFKYRSNLKRKAGSDPISDFVTDGKTRITSL